VRFAIDDFGTGQSSLNYFRHLPADTLKIDGSFVRSMMDSPDDYLLVRGIVAIANAFDRDVMAEGVASEEQSAALLAMGCRVVQGYAVARPMPAAQFVEWCATYPADPRWRHVAGSAEGTSGRAA
jgi:EAL domain-containing protein (putative c-di-GMP-specific phosphodiesterase class I)